MYKYSNGYKHVLKFLRNKGDYIKFFFQIIKSLLQYIYYVVIYVFKYLVKNVCNLCHLSKNWCEICKKKIMYTNVQQYMFQDVAWFMCDI